MTSYPLNITNENGINLVVNSNNQFETLINDEINNCITNSVPTTSFVNSITSGIWHVSYAYDQNDTTLNYFGYSFIFNNNETVFATKNGITKNGTWKTEVLGNQTKFEIKFSMLPLFELDEDWKIVEFSNNQFHLSKRESNSETDYLYFQKN